jgi:hypothetical protein
LEERAIAPVQSSTKDSPSDDTAIPEVSRAKSAISRSAR